MSDVDFRSRGACVGTDPALFHPDRGDMDTVARAKAVCAQCPVVEECLEYALVNIEKFGIWGGLSERERRRLRKGRSKRPPQGISHGPACASNAAYVRHRHRGEVTCIESRTAHSKYTRTRKADAVRIGSGGGE